MQFTSWSIITLLVTCSNPCVRAMGCPRSCNHQIIHPCETFQVLHALFGAAVAQMVQRRSVKYSRPIFYLTTSSDIKFRDFLISSISSSSFLVPISLVNYENTYRYSRSSSVTSCQAHVIKSYYPPGARKLQSLFGSQVVLGTFDGLEEPKVNTEHSPSVRQPSCLYTSVIICRSA